MAIKFSYCFFPLKLLIFRLVIAYFGTPQIAPDHIIFAKRILGEHAPRTPLSTVCLHNVRGPPTHLLCYYIFMSLALFKEFLKNAYQIYKYLI